MDEKSKIEVKGVEDELQKTRRNEDRGVTIGENKKRGRWKKEERVK